MTINATTGISQLFSETPYTYAEGEKMIKIYLKFLYKKIYIFLKHAQANFVFAICD